MRALVTGAGGFIGRNLVRHLIARRFDVVAVGRQMRASDASGFVYVDRLDRDSINGLFATNPIDIAFHLAAAGVRPGDREYHELIRVNATLGPDIVATAAAFGCKAVVSVGSSAEYAPLPEHIPVTEDALLETQRIYGATKAAGTLLTLATAASVGIPVGVLRLFNVFGPGEASYRLLPSLASKLVLGEPVDLSPGTQMRDFIYVDDVCDALIMAACSLVNGDMRTGAYNVATGLATSVRDFSREVARQLGCDLALLRFGALTMRPDDLPFVVGDPSRFKAKAQWSPAHSLETGIAGALNVLNITDR